MRLRGDTIPSNQRAVRLGQRGSRPPPHIQQNPALVRRNMMGDHLFHQVMGQRRVLHGRALYGVGLAD
jgi:hypothetical protein